MNKSSTSREWELDAVVSSRGKSKGCLAMFVERQTSFYVTVKLENRLAIEMYPTIHKLYECFPKDAFKIYTVDRGKKNLLVTPTWKPTYTFLFTLPMLIGLGKEGVMKMPMVFFENFSPRRPT